MARKINILGPIISNNIKWIYDWYKMDATCPKDVQKVLDTIKDTDSDRDLEVIISSPGGSVVAGSEIYTALKTYAQKAAVNGIVTGMAASAASVILCACTDVSISPTAQVMIHNASTWAAGDHRDMSSAANLLRSVDEGIANAYMLRTGMSKQELLDLMGKTTWMNAQEAVKLKFADRILFNDEQKLTASSTFENGIIPDQVINRMRELLKNDGTLFEGCYKETGSNQKGDGQMKWQDYFATLDSEAQALVQAHVSEQASAAVAAALAEAKVEELKEQLTTSAATIQNLQEQLANAKPPENAQDKILEGLTPEARALVVKAQQDAAEANKKVADMLKAQEKQAQVAKAASFAALPVDQEKLGDALLALKNASADGYAYVCELLEKTNNIAKDSGIFKEVGSQGGEASTALEKLNAYAAELQKAEAGLTKEQAFTKAMKANPELYAAYKEESEE